LQRLEKLEQAQPVREGKWHSIIGHSEEELNARMEELMASDEWTEGDSVIRRLIVTPDPARFA
jgi:hypothetical protein